MPARIQGAMHRAPDYCSGIQVGTNWVFAVWTLGAIQFAISADQGASFRTLNVWLPPQDVVDWWTPSTTYPGWLPREDRLSEWWLLADGTAQWIELAEPPLVDWDTLDPGSQASLYLAGLDEILVIPS